MTRIKVDLDGRLPRDIGTRVQWTLRVLKVPVEWWSVTRTRRGYHLEIAIRRQWHPWRVIAVQAILGSDRRRETFNLRRVAAWRTLTPFARSRWNVLFTQKHHISLRETQNDGTD